MTSPDQPTDAYVDQAYRINGAANQIAQTLGGNLLIPQSIPFKTEINTYVKAFFDHKLDRFNLRELDETIDAARQIVLSQGEIE
jgi:hypothetical protein